MQDFLSFFLDVIIIIFKFLVEYLIYNAVLVSGVPQSESRGMQDLCSPARDRTHPLCFGSFGSQTTEPPGKPQDFSK